MAAIVPKLRDLAKSLKIKEEYSTVAWHVRRTGHVLLLGEMRCEN